MKNVFALEPSTPIVKNDSYILSYPHIIDYFARKTSLKLGDVVCGAHMVYGWMPTILELDLNREKIDLDKTLQTLNDAKSGNDVSTEQISDLASFINNSIIGASKLLHFVAPYCFPIWDSKIYFFIHENYPYHSRVNSIKKYIEYIDILKNLKQNENFTNFYNSVQRKIGYEISPLRSLELVMFLNAPSINNSHRKNNLTQKNAQI